MRLIKHLSLVSVMAVLISFNNCSFMDSASASLSRFGISISDSTSALVKSVSKSISSISDSGDEKAMNEYKEDVIASVALQIRYENQKQELENQLSLIAKSHGVVAWRSNSATYIAIGQGLKQANLSPSEMKAVATDVAKQNATVAKLILNGYSL
ncbi:putative lipoprotein [Leptospira sp. 2 VSF19]|uniref:Lipoprotein n=1 Tax=Leptospira soteropolitanensis TaxID=2950025 RepID=A0AAW5VP07_9LEPT|nr:putative lipoprotein [Leptospira soteropolitanensis]MCW7494253.1 putative lipoprotein [Leptospira soteropolitanensis]MCW7501772.1 putative lipoprotein [Leptospira soteropolitanensis]MCW7524099.1 putative lipoprotein [Leptospira soteropolitanensis]MCW7527964.1 putative lipoprotein [Leptospira soteropolitanensis]MCW7531742.1 putative lipoprotein [Leptospira soteropolitanensis]